MGKDFYGDLRLGILGGGQLGRMLTEAAVKLGFQVVVVNPTNNSPAVQVGAKEIVGDKEDRFFIISDLLADLAHWCDRNEVDLPSALIHAAEHYRAETNGRGKQFNA